MFDTDRSDDILDGEVLDAESSPCVALVPVAQPVEWARKSPISRPDPTFLTHLIATADHAPQTCNLRRGSIEDAQTAYAAHPRERRSVTRRTRQVI
jgi:hypothetical protein